MRSDSDALFSYLLLEFKVSAVSVHDKSINKTGYQTQRTVHVLDPKWRQVLCKHGVIVREFVSI